MFKDICNHAVQRLKDRYVTDRKEKVVYPTHDYMEFFVESILEHRGDIQRKTSLEFLVKWLGYSDEHNSWNSYANLRDTDKLHEYLTSNNLHQLIPKKFTKDTNTTP